MPFKIPGLAPRVGIGLTGPPSISLPNPQFLAQSALASKIKMPNIPGLNLPTIGDLFQLVNGRGGRAEGILEKMHSRPDPVLDIDWDVIISLNGLTIRPEYVEEVVLPFPKLESTPVFRAATNIYYPKFTDIGPVSIKLYEDVQLTAQKYIRMWAGKVVNRDGSYNLPYEYKGKITVYPKDATGKRLAQFNLIGCFPTDTDSYTFTSGQTERHVLNQSFSVDSLEIIF